MSAEEIFGQICSILEKSSDEIQPITYKTWIATLKPFKYQNNTLFLVAPSDLHRRRIMTGKDGALHQYLVAALNIVVNTQGADAVIITEDEIPSVADRNELEQTAIPHPMLNEKYTFDNFVIGTSNQFAYAAAVSVAESPATLNNPLFIYGGVGLGKTHLMHAIGNYILSESPSTKVMYTTCEKYTNDFIKALAKHQITAFREKYRQNVDVLMIDDVQFLERKESTQEEIFHNINDLFNANKQIILSSDRPPKNIATLSDRLCSRFEGGLIVDITPPDLEMRTAILRKKAEIEGIPIGEELLLMIAEKASDNVRELEGALKRVTAYSSLIGGSFTAELVNDALKDYHTEVPEYYTADMIIDAVSGYFNITPEDIIGTRRDKSVVLPRQIAYYLCRELTDLSTSRIGEEFNGRDHATIINGIGKIRNAIKDDSEIKSYVDDITMRLRGE